MHVPRLPFFDHMAFPYGSGRSVFRFPQRPGQLWILFAIACGAFFVFGMASSALAGKVLVVQSYHMGFAWDAGYMRGLTSVLEPEHEVRYFELDTKRLPETEFAAQAERALAIFHEWKPDLVVLADDNANKLLARTLLPTGVPIVYLGLNGNPRDYGLYGHEHVAGLMERPLLLPSVHMARKVYPQTLRRLLFLFDASLTSSRIAESTFEGKESLALGGIRADLKLVKTMEEWMNAVRGAAGTYDMVILGLYQRLYDATGTTVVDDEEVLARTMREMPVPSLALWDYSVGRGRVPAGMVHVGAYQGRVAGEIAQRMLAGERGVSIPLSVEDGVFMFSRFEARRQGLVIPPELEVNALIME